MIACPPRARAFAVLIFTYALALAVALAVAAALPTLSPLWRSAVADIAATVAVFVLSMVRRNTSLYDPYWSVAPLALAAAWAQLPAGPGAEPLRILVVLTGVAVWGLRLTWNFLRRWRGLADEDWRYADLRAHSPRAFWAVNLFGLQLFPTVLVFAGLVPVFVVLTAPARPLGPLDAVAAGLLVLAIAVEAVADRQLRRFLDARPAPGSFLATGLWRYSRHPNYFGEISFWWALGLFGIAAAPDLAALSLVGPLAITALFAGVSIPIMDRRMRARRPGYAAHCARTSAVVPWPPRPER